MARAKCQYCKKWLDTKEAFHMVVNDKSKYWCNENCYRITEEETEKQARNRAEYDEIFEITKEIFGYEFSGHSILQRELKVWEKLSTRQKIIEYLKENKDWLSVTMSKEFANDYNRVRYYSAIISSKLHDYKPKTKVVEKPSAVIDETMYQAPTHTLNKRRSLDDLEDMF